LLLAAPLTHEATQARSAFNKPFSLRQQDTIYFICSSFFARRAKNEIQKEEY
jgi:hypothetical protein